MKLLLLLPLLTYGNTSFAFQLANHQAGPIANHCRINIGDNAISYHQMRSSTCPAGGGVVWVSTTGIDLAPEEGVAVLADSYIQRRSWCGSLWGHRGADIDYNDKFTYVYVPPTYHLRICDDVNYGGECHLIVGLEGSGTELHLSRIGMAGRVSSVSCHSHTGPAGELSLHSNVGSFAN